MLAEHLVPQAVEWDRSNTVGASEIGACARRTWYSKHDTPADPNWQDSWGFKERGHVVEAWAVKTLLANSVNMIECGDEQITHTDGFLSATPDGYLPNEDTTLDIKSFDPRKSKLPEEQHIQQVRLGARLRGAKQGVLLYINASDYEDRKEFGPWLAFDDDELADCKARARAILTNPSADAFMREGKFADECGRFDCPFQVTCLGAAITGAGELSDRDKLEIDRLRGLYHEARAQADTAKTDQNRIKESIREIFRAADVRSAPGRARISRSNGRTKLDTEAMERAGIDLTPFRSNGNPFDSVTVE